MQPGYGGQMAGYPQSGQRWGLSDDAWERSAYTTSNIGSESKQSQYQQTQQQQQRPKDDTRNNTSNTGGASGDVPPRYAQPMTTQSLRYMNEEQDFIRECFSSASYRTIATLPNELKPNQVTESRAAHIDNNLFGSSPCSVPLIRGTSKFFTSFEYTPDPESVQTKLAERHRRVQLMRAKRRGEQIEGEDVKGFEDDRPAWMPPSHAPSLAHTKPPPKYQLADPLASARDPSARMDYISSHHPPSQRPYSMNDQVTERRQEPLYGVFVPSGTSATRGGGMCRTTRQSLRNIVAILDKTVKEDWQDCAVDVYADDDDYIVIEFGLHTIINVKGLKAYMGTICNVNPIISEFGLRKVPEIWNHAPGNGCVYFAFRPHWVARSSVHSYYTLHPDEK